MNFVEPIRDPDMIQQLEIYFKNKNERDYILFLLGIYTGLRISDILLLKVKDLKGKSRIIISEKKTQRKKNNTRPIKIHPVLKRALHHYLKDKPDHQYIIKSRVGKNKAITRERAYMILKNAADVFEIDSLGCHSMRKTLGYHVYKSTKDVVKVQKLLNHEYPSYTLAYIGIEHDEVNKTIADFSYY